MKEKLIMSILLSLTLIGCNDVSSSSSENGSEDSSTSLNGEESLTIPQTDKYKYYLGYGDYFASVSKSMQTEKLKEEYERLCEVNKGEVKDIFQHKYQKGLDEFFNINNKVEISISTSYDELLKINEYHNKNNKESYRICDVDITINDYLIHYEDVGFRLKGNTSRGLVIEDNGMNLRHYKLNFAETFDDEYRDDTYTFTDENEIAYREDRTLFGLEKIDIRWNKNEDQTYLKEYYAYEVYRNNDLLAAHSNPFNLSFNIDGDIQNSGVYLAVEPIDKDFLKRNLVSDYNSGDLYKMGWTYEGAKLNSTSSSLFGVESQEKKGDYFETIGYIYDLKTNKKTSAHEDIKAFINKLIKTGTSNFENMLKEYTDYDRLMKYFAVSFLLSDPDDLRGNFNNTYLYFIPNENGKNRALFIPTDHDRALGSTGGSEPSGHHGILNSPFAEQTGYSKNDMPLYNKSILMESNKTLRQAYLKEIENVINGQWFTYESFKKYYDIAYSNYSNSTVLGNKVRNKDVSFSLKENDNIHNSWNLSIDVYFTEKRKTLKDYINII